MGARLVKAVVKGETVWVEADRPKACGECGGTVIGADWSACLDCRKHCRWWPCRADGCGWRKQDPEHECEDGPLPSSALRGA